jgi:hypothetical protein
MPTRRRALGVELLEARDVPSGNVTVAVTKVRLYEYRLVLTGDEYDNTLYINQQYIYGGSGTTVNGVGSISLSNLLGASDKIVGVKADLGDGNDHLEVFSYAPIGLCVGGDVTVQMGKGNDTAILRPGTNVRNVTVNQKAHTADNDTTTLACDRITGGVTVVTQGGTDRTTVSGVIAGNVKVTSTGGGALGSDPFEESTRTTVNSTASIGGGMSVLFTHLPGSSFPTVNLSGTIQKELVVRNPGNDGAKLNFNGLVVHDDLRIQTGAIKEDFDWCECVFNNTQIDGSLLVKGGIFRERMYLTNTDIAGDLIFNAVIGDTEIHLFDGTDIGGKLTHTVGKTGNPAAPGRPATLGLPVFECLADNDSVYVRKGVSLSYGPSDHYQVSLKNNPDNDTSVNLKSGGFSFKSSQTSQTPWDDSRLILDGVDVTGPLRVTAGAGQDTIALRSLKVRGDVSVNTGSESDTIRVDSSDLQGDFTVNTGTATDLLLFGSNSDPDVRPATSILGDFRCKLGRQGTGTTDRDLLKVVAQTAPYPAVSLQVQGVVTADCVQPGTGSSGSFAFFDFQTGAAQRVGYSTFWST